MYLRFLFVLVILLTVILGIGLIVPDMRDNELGRIGLWCGLISQLLLASVMYSEIRRHKRRRIDDNMVDVGNPCKVIKII